MVQLYTVASDIQIWRTVKICTSLQKYINICLYHSYNYLDLSAVAARNKLTVEVKYHVIQGLTVTV